MTFKSRLLTFFAGTWTENRLLSRKWWLVGGLVASVGLDVAGRALSSDTLGYMRDVTMAYLAVQGALDWRGNRKKPKDPGGEV